MKFKETKPHLAWKGKERGGQREWCCVCRIRVGPICYLVRAGGLQAERGLGQAARRGKFMNRPLTLVTAEPSGSGN